MRKILVIDDDQGVRMLYADELADEGYEVVTYGDGSRLIEFIKKERPDVVVMDIRLGKYDGLDLLQDVRNTFDRLPVIICTAYPSFRHDLKSVAADDYVLKSSDLRELKLKIGMAFEGRKELVSFGGQSNMEGMKNTPIEQIDLPWRDTR
jgi:two-component system response regulator (stage 0 sporulation protein F)